MVMPQKRERVVPRLIEEEMRESFIDYSMSVIVQRALPDVRDGLKPVHRRILYAMSELGLSPARPYKKSASVVGEVLGKYHPHGDSAVYDSLVRMVQGFSLRYPLVDGQGNFGSIDGDNAAAYRYTEAKLARIAEELLVDLERDTVDFSDTFDGQRQEPDVLPARLPNLLVNGSSGIAVGMSTNVPPHNLREIGAAVRHLAHNPECEVEELMERVPGPDFPTGALIVGRDGIEDAYRTGRGRIVMRARIQREKLRGGKEQLVVTEIPYGVSKGKIMEQIVKLVRAQKLDQVTDLRDESDRDGLRVTIELKRGADPTPVLNRLYKRTHLQSTFGAILLALDHGVPREMNLKEILEHYRDHRLEVIRRRSEHELEEARAEEHITQGLLVALDNIDAIIAIIREAEDRATATDRIREEFDLSEAQADAILNMRLGRLTALETRQLRTRMKELRSRIGELEKLLASDVLQLEVMLEELENVVERYGDERRTEIISGAAEVTVEDLIAEEDVVVTLSHQNYIKRIPMYLYRRRLSSGKPLAGMEKYDEDFLEHAFIASTHDALLFFTTGGQVHALPVHEIPEGGRASRGRALIQLLDLAGEDGIASVVSVTEFSEDQLLIFLTAGGTIKRTTLDQFANIRAGGIHAINLKDDDRLLDVQLSDGAHDLVLVTRGGRAIRFPERDVSAMGRTAQGVKGIELRDDDGVVGMVVVRRHATLCTVTANGYGKRTPVEEYSVQRRGGLGSVTLQVTERTGDLVAAKEVLPGDELMVLAQSGKATRLSAEDVAVQGRNTQGRRLLALESDDRVVEVSRVAQEREEEDGADREAGADDAASEGAAAENGAEVAGAGAAE